MSLDTPLELPRPRPAGPQIGPVLGLIGWVLLLGGLLGGLHLLGRGALAMPPLMHPSHWPRWAIERGALTAAFALLRCGAELVAAYLLLTTLGGLGARLAGLARAARVLDRLSLPALSKLLSAVAGVSLATALSAGPVTEAAWGAPAAQAAPANWSIPLMRVVGAGAPPRAFTPARAAAQRKSTAPARTWTVSPGDNLWSIAATTLADRRHRPPTDAEVAVYWQRLIAENRTRLASPEVPELIFAGQVFVLPPI